MGPVVSKQDIQTMINTLQNRVFERTATKQDFQTINDLMKSLVSINQQNQQALRQAEYQRSQLARRMMAVEARLVQLDQEIRGYKDILNRIESVQTQPQQMVMTQSETLSNTGDMPVTQYVYRPI